jgi:hypothetical protein
MAMFDFDAFIALRRYTTNLGRDVDVPGVTPIGFIYRDPQDRIVGWIEEIGPEFYIVTINKIPIAAYDGSGLEELERKLWDSTQQLQLA